MTNREMLLAAYSRICKLLGVSVFPDEEKRQLEAQLADMTTHYEKADMLYRMYATAWERELGGPFVPKVNLIDVLVATTRERMTELKNAKELHREYRDQNARLTEKLAAVENELRMVQRELSVPALDEAKSTAEKATLAVTSARKAHESQIRADSLAETLKVSRAEVTSVRAELDQAVKERNQLTDVAHSVKNQISAVLRGVEYP